MHSLLRLKSVELTGLRVFINEIDEQPLFLLLLTSVLIFAFNFVSSYAINVF